VQELLTSKLLLPCSPRSNLLQQQRRRQQEPQTAGSLRKAAASRDLGSEHVSSHLRRFQRSSRSSRGGCCSYQQRLCGVAHWQQAAPHHVYSVLLLPCGLSIHCYSWMSQPMYDLLGLPALLQANLFQRMYVT
jgi:hypothetical protein